MKEIGEKLKEARENIGVSLEEAATDLKVTVSQLQNVEDGNMEAFKDVLNLKYLIRDYSKYLGLNKEEMIDEYNEYLFDYTSKISLDDIKNAASKKEDKIEKKVKSPYTQIKDNSKQVITAVILSALILIIIIVMIIVIVKDKEEDKKDNIIAYSERM